MDKLTVNLDQRPQQRFMKRPKANAAALMQYRQNILQRPARMIVKPKRYMTTSSSSEDDIALKKKIIEKNKNIDDIDLENDINDIRQSLNNENVNHSNIPESRTSYINQSQELNESYNWNVNDSNPLQNFSALQAITYADLSAPNVNNNTSHGPSWENNYGFNHLEQNRQQINVQNKSLVNEREKTPMQHGINVDHTALIHEKLSEIQRKLDNVPTTEDFANLNRKLDNVLNKNQKNMPDKPECLPLASAEDVEKFEGIEEDKYDNVVLYLKFLGGLSAAETIKFCIKECFLDEAIRNYSLWGEKQNNEELYNKKIIRAIYEAAASSHFYTPPDRRTFYESVQEAIRLAKQRLRNNTKRVPGEAGRRTKRRTEADTLYKNMQQS